MHVRNVRNQRQGAAFEKLFEHYAKTAGLLAVRNGQIVRWLPNGNTLAVKSNLDWTLIADCGRVAFVDTKSFQGDSFTFSMIDGRQLGLALAYTTRGCEAGFAVHLRALNEIVFYSADAIMLKGPRSRFDVADGRLLGTLHGFDLRQIWRKT